MSSYSISRRGFIRHTALAATVVATGVNPAWGAALADAGDPWVVYPGAGGPGQGKHIVLISGDEEYRSEEGLPQLGKILARHHGFKCTVLFSINPEDGTIDPNNRTNLPGLAALETADLMIIATRFRELPDAQMRHIAAYIDRGKPVIGIRAAVVAFDVKPGSKYGRFGYRGNEWEGGFGRQILGETWISHHGQHGQQSTRGVIAPGAEQHPIVRGCADIWGPTDVYTVRLPMAGDCQPLVLGQVLTGMQPTDPPVVGPQNQPLMPIAWTKTYRTASGQSGRVFTSTMGDAMDLQSPGLRRLWVNAGYWCLGMEDKIPAQAKVDCVGTYQPSPFGFNRFKKGVKPSDLALQ